jgi:MoaA/NifB/PqqE/SkfB family radical SAM enzyme
MMDIISPPSPGEPGGSRYWYHQESHTHGGGTLEFQTDNLYLQRKRENFLSTLGTLKPGHSSRTVPNRPLLLHLEITSRCNLRCLKCGHATDPPGTSRTTPRNLPYSVIETFDEYFASAVVVHTFGYGEMFLYAKLKRLVERLKGYGCIVDGITNGVLVDKEEVEWLVDYGYDELTFSIDGVEPETMRRLRGVDVEKIWRTLAYLKERKREMGKECPRVVVNFVAQADNYHELPGLIRKLSDLDIFFMGVNPLMPAELEGDPDTPYNKLYREFGLENVPRERLEAVLSLAQQLARRANISFQAYIDLDALYVSRYGSQRTKLVQIVPQEHLQAVQREHTLEPYYCSYPWTSVYVNADSGSRICCFMDGNLGQIQTGADFDRVWNEGTIVEIREAISKGEVHPFCESCVGLGRYQHSSIELQHIAAHLQVPFSGAAAAD